MSYEIVKDQCKKLKLASLPEALESQKTIDNIESIPFIDRLSNLFDYELTSRKTKRIKSLIRNSKMKYDCDLSTIDFSDSRGLSRQQIANLLTGSYLNLGKNIVIEGATGTGKTYLGCAFGTHACRQLKSVLYLRTERLLTNLSVGKKTGDYEKLMRSLKRIDLLILDDFGMSRNTFEQTKDLMEFIEDRNESRSTIFLSQLASKDWYQLFSDETFADAIMDRIINNSTFIHLKGDSMRKVTNLVEK